MVAIGDDDGGDDDDDDLQLFDDDGGGDCGGDGGDDCEYPRVSVHVIETEETVTVETVVDASVWEEHHRHRL